MINEVDASSLLCSNTKVRQSKTNKVYWISVTYIWRGDESRLEPDNSHVNPGKLPHRHLKSTKLFSDGLAERLNQLCNPEEKKWNQAHRSPNSCRVAGHCEFAKRLLRLVFQNGSKTTCREDDAKKLATVLKKKAKRL